MPQSRPTTINGYNGGLIPPQQFSLYPISQKMPTNRRNKGRSRNGRRVNISKRLVATQGDAAAYRGQQIAILEVPGDIRLAVTTAGSSIAQVFAINAANIQTNFHGYFNSVFQEYRIRRVVFHITAISAGAPGASFFRFEEKNSGSPTLNEMANSTSLMKVNNSNNATSTFTMTWIARDLVDLGFEQITTDPNSAFLKIFTDSTDMGAPASTYLWAFRPVATVEFRGLGLN